MTERGPIYDVELFELIPTGDGLLQVMPSRDDLAQTRTNNDRVAIGYEVLTEYCRRLQAIVDRAATTADGAVIVQTADETVWRTEGPEGRPQRSEYFQNGMAVFRGAVRVEMKRIADCYSTCEKAKKAREA